MTDMVNAHPGRTDGNGGHTCRTNCEKWGLDYGEYHYHNGGSSGSGGGSFSGSTSTVQPSGPSPEEIAEREKSQGEKDGYAAGLEAGYEGKTESPSPTGSDAYIEGYNAGYKNGYTKGAKKLETDKSKAQNEGYEFGKKNDSITIPKAYQNNAYLKAAFEEGFNKAVSERDELKKKEYNKQGYNDGKKDIYNEPKDVKDIYIKAYKEGYEKAQAELKETYLQQGHEAAFKSLVYEEPKLDNAKFIDWYKEGFESNKEVKKIKDAAYNLGLSGEQYKIPQEYVKAEKIYRHYYEKGFKEYEEERKEDTAKTAGGTGIITLAWLARRFYVAKKMVS
ncbi:YHYH domain-containing protein [Peribacillus tepidiphilus]|uniref:YHYH domain-containing protein n=1 Tax=Peribacillus tepidiphilus TaxID=2652445 RepID=UPI003B84A3E5